MPGRRCTWCGHRSAIPVLVDGARIALCMADIAKARQDRRVVRHIAPVLNR